MWPDVGGEVLQIAYQIERFAAGGAQSQRIPALPYDKIRLPTSFGQEAFQNRHPGIIAVADPDLARDRRTTLQRLGAVLVGQFKMRKTAACDIEHAADAPVRPFACGFA